MTSKPVCKINWNIHKKLKNYKFFCWLSNQIEEYRSCNKQTSLIKLHLSLGSLDPWNGFDIASQFLSLVLSIKRNKSYKSHSIFTLIQVWSQLRQLPNQSCNHPLCLKCPLKISSVHYFMILQFSNGKNRQNVFNLSQIKERYRQSLFVKF